MLEAMGLVKLGVFSGEYLAIYSWCIVLAAKLAIFVRMDLGGDMATYSQREKRSKIFGMPFPFLYFS